MQTAVTKGGGPKADGFYKMTPQLERAVLKWQDADDRYIANRKTVGEKRVATLKGGPIGRYLASDMRTATRVSNESSNLVYPKSDHRTPIDKANRNAKIVATMALGAAFATTVFGGRRGRP
jgi:hypothetical protein